MHHESNQNHIEEEDEKCLQMIMLIYRIEFQT
jgi:hypothetical protein